MTLPDEETRQLFENNEISSVCAGSDSLFLGSGDGFVSIIGKSWKAVKKFQAHEAGRITHMRQVEGTSLLVTVAVSIDDAGEPERLRWVAFRLFALKVEC